MTKHELSLNESYVHLWLRTEEDTDALWDSVVSALRDRFTVQTGDEIGDGRFFTHDIIVTA